MENIKLRITYTKGENARHLGHLDTLRAFTRAFRRAELPLAYSNGFNPHPVMTFAMPLGVGVTSLCEIMQAAFTAVIAPDELCARLNAALPQGFAATEAQFAPGKLPEIVSAAYMLDMVLQNPVQSSAIQHFFADCSIVVIKVNKNGETPVQLMRHIHQAEITSNEDCNLKLYVSAAAGSKLNINPTLIVKGMTENIEGFAPVLVKPQRVALGFAQ